MYRRRPREPELDLVFRAGDQQIPLQVKLPAKHRASKRHRMHQVVRRRAGQRAQFGLLITREDTPPIDDPRIVAIPLSTFLLLR